MKEEKGITLVALIITVIVLLIISSVAIQVGKGSIENTRLQAFYTQLEIVQKRVDDIATTNESYVEADGSIVYLKEQGTPYENLNSSQKDELQNILRTECENTALIVENFRYFTKEQLGTVLDLPQIEYDVFIDFDNRVVIAEEGIYVKEEEYHVLENFLYYSNQNSNSNLGTIESLNYNIIKYGDNYKITVIPNYLVVDLKKDAILKYKKATSKYWETSTNLEMIISGPGDYNIIYSDANNSISKMITVTVDLNGTPNVTEI